jgi:hypothetical protein
VADNPEYSASAMDPSTSLAGSVRSEGVKQSALNHTMSSSSAAKDPTFVADNREYSASAMDPSTALAGSLRSG